MPTFESLGTGWSGEISVLFDPASNPAEIVARAAQLPEVRKQERRDAIANPTNRISGWSHAHFDFRGTNRSCRYEVQVERYRSKEAVVENFGRLVDDKADGYQRVSVQVVGEAAAIYRDRTGMTMWFRRGLFKVWISPLTSSASWEADSAFQHLAKVIDQGLDKATANKKAPAPKTD